MHFLSLRDIKSDDIHFLIDKAIESKKDSNHYAIALEGKTLLMIFAKPSLRTRLSFEVGMTQLGGHAIYYDISTSPLGKGKESISDTGKTASQYADIIMARLFAHSDLEELAQGSDVPVINGLTDFEHPCQVMADLMTIKEKKGRLSGLKLAYVGDGNNNITHSLLYSSSKLGMKISIASPRGEAFEPNSDVVKNAITFAKESGGEVFITNDAHKCVEGADVVVTDSWMSYHIPKELEPERIRLLQPYQVNSTLMAYAKPNTVFMHCLPATRGQEVTVEVIDGQQSIVWDEAANRLHIQKIIMLWLLEKI